MSGGTGRPRVFAHRGGRDWAPENTMVAFRKSVEAGVDGIELDVQRCATGELVVIHDADVARTTNGVGLVRDSSYAELKRLNAGEWFDPEFEDEYIPLLSEVLDLISGKLVLNIEIKNTPIEYPGIDDDLIDFLSDYPHRDKLIISSFDHYIIKSLHEKDESLMTALLADALLVDLTEYAAKLGTRAWHPCFDALRQEAVEEAHAAGLAVNTWTVNTERDWRHAVRIGVDGIVTDDPDGLMTFLQRTGLRSSSS